MSLLVIDNDVLVDIGVGCVTIYNDMQRLIGVFAAETGLVWLLHRVAPMFPVDLTNFDTWARFTPPDQIAMAAARYVALGLGYWLLLSTVAYTTGLMARLPGLVRSAEWATLPVVRRAARRAVALSLATTTMAPTVAIVPAGSVSHQTILDNENPEESDNDRIVVGISDHNSFIPPGATVPRRPTADSPSVPTPRLSRSTAGPPPQLTASPPAIGPHSGVDPSTGDLITVQPGDNLWTIAAHHLRTHDPASPLTEPAIVRYWVRVVELNRPSLRSQNPDWIYPGEEIRLPPINQ